MTGLARVYCTAYTVVATDKQQINKETAPWGNMMVKHAEEDHMSLSHLSNHC
jgi:hypothetical protein